MNIFVDTLPSGAALGPGDWVVSFSGQFQLILQGDGNLVLSNGQSPLWSSLTAGKTVSQCIMQTDGNLVIYDPTNTPLWASNTNGFPGAFLRVQNDGNCVIYTAAAIADTAHHHSPIMREDNLRSGQFSAARRHATLSELITAVVYCPV